jgi:thiaminase
MGRQGTNIKKEEIVQIIDLYKQGCNIKEIIQETEFSDTEIKEVIENYENNLYDSHLNYVGKKARTNKGQIKIQKPLIHYE